MSPFVFYKKHPDMTVSPVNNDRILLARLFLYCHSPFFPCTQAFSQHFSNRNGRALTLSFIHPAVVSAPAPETSSSNLPLPQSALRPFMKTESVCNDAFTVTVHCQ